MYKNVCNFKTVNAIFKKINIDLFQFVIWIKAESLHIDQVLSVWFKVHCV